ncbi:diguanylate cyclase domain-containing protein [Haliea atlantica]
MRARTIRQAGQRCIARLTLALMVGAGSLWPLAGEALDPERAPSQYLYDRFGRDQGMPSDTVWVARQDPDGYLWLGTKNGLVRFDGKRFTLFNKQNQPAMRSNDIRDIEVAEDGSLWLATYGGGVLHRDGRDLSVLDKTHGLADDIVHDIHLSANGDIWFATSGGVSRLRDGEFASWHHADGLTDNRVFRIAEDAGGGLWFATLTNGVSYFDGKRFRNYTEGQGLDSTQVHLIFDDPELGLTLSTITGSLYSLRDGEVSPLQHPLQGRFPVHSTLRDSDGNLWLGTYAKGLWRQSPDGEVVEVPLESTQPGYVFDLFEDREGNLWAATLNGVYRLRDSAFLPWGAPEGLADAMFVVTQSPTDDAIWAGSEGSGLFRLTPAGEVTRFDTRDGLSNHNISALWVDADNTVWAGTFGGGLNRLSPDGSVTHFTQDDGLPDNHIMGLHRADDGRLWISADGGIGWLDTQGSFHRLEQLPDTLYRQVNEDSRGRLWIASNNGLLRMQGDHMQWWSQEAGLESSLISTTYEDDDGMLWIGSRESGLARLDGDQLFQFTEKHGLPQLSVLAILEDRLGNLWMSGADGLVKIPRAQLNAVAEGRSERVNARLYNERDGLRSAQFLGGYQPAGWRAEDGRLWFANNRGLVAFDPRDLRQDAGYFTPLIEAVRVNGQSVPLNTTTPLQLPPEASSLEVDYTVPRLGNPTDLQFRYRLEGMSDDWQYAGNRRTAFFTGLPAGDMRLSIEAVTASGSFAANSPAQASLALYHQPHWYQTWWFRLIAGVSALAIILGLYRLALYRVTLRQRQLETLVNRRTRELQIALSRVEAISRMDGLTGIANRRYFDENLASAWSQCAAQSAPLSIIMLDIDFFKQYNDGLGHQAGDDCLRQVAEALEQGVLREEDLIARYGGEEFIALLPGADSEAATAIARRIQSKIRQLGLPHPDSPLGDAVTISLGCATAWPSAEAGPDTLLQRADHALYRAKHRGRNRLEVATAD